MSENRFEMSENRSIFLFSTTLGPSGRQALVQALQEHNIPVLDSTTVVRPKLLGSRLTLTRQHAAAQKEEVARLKAKFLGKCVKALPHSVDAKFKNMFLQGYCASRCCKPLLRAFSNLITIKLRLFSGHWADAKFRVGSQVSSHILIQACQGQHLAWHIPETQGPLALTRRSMARPTGLQSVAAHGPSRKGRVGQQWPQQYQLFTHHHPSAKPELQHILRDAWRALQ